MTAAPPGWEGILDPGERILWQGRPDGRIAVTGEGIVQSVFGVFFLGFALFWTGAAFWMTAGSGTPLDFLFPLFGLPFIAVGSYLVFGHWLWSAYARRHSWYTLTDRRAIIATAYFGKKALQSWPIAPDTRLDLIEGPPDTIWFAEWTTRTKNGTQRHRRGFERIEDGRRVLNLMRQVQRSEEMAE
jgi:hypothetical protein